MRYIKKYIEYLKEGNEILLAPNGKPSNLPENLYKIVRTNEFKEWFGDWLNNPGKASKILDENGEPLVVYHASDVNFDVFEYKGMFDGFFFSTNKLDDEFVYDGVLQALDNGDIPSWIQEIMKNTGMSIDEVRQELETTKYKYIRPFFLNIRKIYPIEWIGYVSDENWTRPGFEILYINKARERSFDGVDFIRESDGKRIIVALNQNQMKIADGTNTTFSNSNNINI